MTHRKNIDRLFQEKFRDFEQTPPESVWNNIEQRLGNNKKRRVALWWWAGGIAAGLALLFSLYLNRETNPASTTPVVTQPATQSVEPSTPIPTNQRPSFQLANTEANNSRQQTQKTTQTPKQYNHHQSFDSNNLTVNNLQINHNQPRKSSFPHIQQSGIKPLAAKLNPSLTGAMHLSSHNSIIADISIKHY